MAFDFNSMNKGGKKFDFQLPKDAPYEKLQEMTPGDIFQVMGLFISKSKNKKFKDHPVAIISAKNDFGGFYLDLPEHTTETVKEILNNPDAVDAINAGVCGIQITEYEIDLGKFRGIQWINFDI